MKIRFVLALILLSILAAALQVEAIRLLAETLAARSTLTAFFAVQAFAALAGAAFIVCAGSARLRRPWWKGLAYNASFIFFLPVGGQLLLCGVLLLQRLLPKTARTLDAGEVTLPSFEPRLLDGIQQGAGSRAQAQASHASINVGERMAAMSAIRGVPPHVTEQLLHNLLSDSQDEMRLLAYGILDQAEKRIMHDITEAKIRLEERRGTRRAAIDHAHLAELHWELVYQGLAQGDMRQHMLELSATHARAALALRPSVAGMHYLLGRHALLQQHPAQAREHFHNAEKHGMSQARVAPWLAEALFQEGCRDDVARQMKFVAAVGANSQLQSVARYWQ